MFCRKMRDAHFSAKHNISFARRSRVIVERARMLRIRRPRERWEAEVVKSKRESSKLLAGFGAVTPGTKPEDFAKVRAAFEQAVAEEVMHEMKQGTRKANRHTK
jgi:hypothetical protein